MSDELKPCPFCGNPADTDDLGDGWVGVGCTAHGEALQCNLTPERWNSRPREEELRREIDELKRERESVKSAFKFNEWEGETITVPPGYRK